VSETDLCAQQHQPTNQPRAPSCHHQAARGPLGTCSQPGRRHAISGQRAQCPQSNRRKRRAASALRGYGAASGHDRARRASCGCSATATSCRCRHGNPQLGSHCCAASDSWAGCGGQAARLRSQPDGGDRKRREPLAAAVASHRAPGGAEAQVEPADGHPDGRVFGNAQRRAAR
jgi:hypothetical protein